MRSKRSGFTLVELMVVAALLATLGALLGQLMKGSFQMYEQGGRRGDYYGTAIHVLDVLTDDLLAIHSGPDGRFLLEFEGLGGGAGSGEGMLLRMVRGIPGGESNHPVLRQAGTEPQAIEPYLGGDPTPEERKKLSPPAGLVEVAYALLQEPRDPVGVFTLFRGTSAPVGHPSGMFGGTTDQSPRDEVWVRKHLRPVATDIAGLWILCFGQETEDWSEDLVLSGEGGKEQSGLNWDSTRGILSPKLFPLARGPGSLLDSRDDIYPRAVRLLVHVVRGRRPDGLLRASLSEDQALLRLRSTELLPSEDDSDRFVKVGQEWMELRAMDGSDAEVTRARRNFRGKSQAHPIGTPVFAGRMFRKTLALPAYRSFWQEATR